MLARLAMILALVLALPACGFLGDDDSGKPAPVRSDEFGSVHTFTVGLPTNAIFKRAHKVEIGVKEPYHRSTENGFQAYYGDPSGSDAAGSGFSVYMDALPADRELPAVFHAGPHIPEPQALPGGAYGRAYRSDIGFDTLDFAARYGNHILHACVLFSHGIFESDLEAFTVLGCKDKEVGDFMSRLVAFYRASYEVIPTPPPVTFD